MKKIVCFGDSNTFGFIPETGERYDADSRWSGILKSLAKDKFKITEAGCNNRTAFSDNPAGYMQTGYKALEPIVKSKPDCIILAIGTNDLQFGYNNSIKDIEKGMESLVKSIKDTNSGIDIIIAAPSVIKKNILGSFFAAMFDETSIEKSFELPQICKKIAEKYNCSFIDFNKIAEASDTDGLHYDKEAHIKIAHAVFDLLCKKYGSLA